MRIILKGPLIEPIEPKYMRSTNTSINTTKAQYFSSLTNILFFYHTKSLHKYYVFFFFQLCAHFTQIVQYYMRIKYHTLSFKLCNYHKLDKSIIAWRITCMESNQVWLQDPKNIIVRMGSSIPHRLFRLSISLVTKLILRSLSPDLNFSHQQRRSDPRKIELSAHILFWGFILIKDKLRYWKLHC